MFETLGARIDSAEWTDPKAPSAVKVQGHLPGSGEHGMAVFERTLGPTTALHDSLWVSPDRRSEGVARRFELMATTCYPRLGINLIRLKSEGRGSYHWARNGYVPDPSIAKGADTYVEEIAADGAEKLKGFLDYGDGRGLYGYERQPIEVGLSALRHELAEGSIRTMRDLADFGWRFSSRVDLAVAYAPGLQEVMTVRDQEVEQWIGRLVLYSTSWLGQRRLTSQP
jgi:hypothetical protein